MSKKRKCRYTPDELTLHEEAVRLRKMTDKQLVEAFHRAAEPETVFCDPSVVQKYPDNDETINNPSEIQKLISALSEGKCKGIKGATVYKISEFATEMGLL